MDVIIPRGSIIPYKKTKKYTTDTDFIDNIEIKIYEGERKFTKDNILIGDFILSGIEKQKRGIPEIQISFEIDSDGIIKIKAEDLDNPLNKKSIQISGNKQNLSEEQIEKIIENAKIMDQIDKTDKYKKESYISLIDSSKKIIENLTSNEIQIPEDLKNDIKNNVIEILEWLNNNSYDIIDLDKYKELLHDYKMNYSIYIIQNNDIINLESAEDQKHDKPINYIELYDPEDNLSNYSEQIKYFRSIVDEYNDIYKQIKIIQYMNNNLNNNIIDNIITLYKKVNDYANDILINIFIDKNINNEKITDYCNRLNNYDIEFKESFNEINEEYNVMNKFLTLIKSKEEYYLNLLENTNNEDTTTINDINSKLDVIIEFDTIIYKIQSGYSSIENTQILDMIQKLNLLN